VRAPSFSAEAGYECLMGALRFAVRVRPLTDVSIGQPVRPTDTQTYSSVNQLTNYFVQPLTYGTKGSCSFAN
jgi:hypothetical protein